MNNNISPVFKAETASDLKSDIFKIGLGLCVYLPLCSFFATVFIEIFKLIAKPEGESAEAFITSWAYPFYSLTVSLIPIIAAIAIVSLMTKRKPSVLMFKPCIPNRGVVLYFLASLILIPLGTIASLLSQSVLGNIGIETDGTLAPNGVLATVFFFIAHVIFAPIFEEILFRGLILERLRRYGDLFAIITTAFLFSIMHSSLDSYFPTFISGIILSLSAVYTGSILVPTLAHFINNLFSCIMIVLTPHIGDRASNSVYIALLASFAVISCIAIIVLQKRGDNAFKLKFTEKILTGGRKTSILLTSFTVLIFIIYSISLAISAI